jgi:hypothetical protein
VHDVDRVGSHELEKILSLESVQVACSVLAAPPTHANDKAGLDVDVRLCDPRGGRKYDHFVPSRQDTVHDRRDDWRIVAGGQVVRRHAPVVEECE